MGIAAAAFHWTPNTYWRSTRHEFFAAFEALKEMNKPSDDVGK